MDTAKIWNFVKRNAVILLIGLIVVLAFTIVLPYQMKKSGEISVKNTEIIQAQSVSDYAKEIQLKKELKELQTPYLMWTILLMIIFIPFSWALRTVLDGLSLYCYTNISFLQEFSEGSDKKFSEEERASFMQVIALTPIANSLLIIAVFIGIFFVFFS